MLKSFSQFGAIFVVALLVIIGSIAVFSAPTPGAATVLKDEQIAGPAGLTAASLKVLFPDGTSRYVVIGAGLTLDATVSPMVLRAEIPPVAGTTRHERLQSNVDGSWRLSAVPTGAILVTRNGLIMLQGVDYGVQGQNVVFAPAQGSAPTDIVTALY